MFLSVQQVEKTCLLEIVAGSVGIFDTINIGISGCPYSFNRAIPCPESLVGAVNLHPEAVENGHLIRSKINKRNHRSEVFIFFVKRTRSEGSRHPNNRLMRSAGNIRPAET